MSITRTVVQIMRPNHHGVSEWWTIEDISERLPSEYEGRLSGNGSSVFQSDRGVGTVNWEGHKGFVIEKEYDEGKLGAVRLAGFAAHQQSVRSNHVPAAVRKVVIVPKAECSLCGTGTRLECDHKDGRKDTSNGVTDTDPSHYQPLCKHCNGVKREACKKCTSTGLRYNACRRGFSDGWTVGSKRYQPATVGCNGCFMFDPIKFIKTSCR